MTTERPRVESAPSAGAAVEHAVSGRLSVGRGAHHRAEKPWRSAFYRAVTIMRPGFAELEGLPPGPYGLVVARWATDNAAPELVGELRLTLKAGERRELRPDFDVLAGRLGVIEGVVRGVEAGERVVLEIVSKKDGESGAPPGSRSRQSGTRGKEFRDIAD